MKKLGVIALFGLMGLSLWGQQDPLFSQYMFNRLIINPAYAGSHEQLSLVGIWRQQWTGWEGAPVTQSIGIHTPTADQRHGFGLHLVHDQVGYTTNTLGSFSYAYRVPMGTGHLALGLTAGMNSYWVRISEVETWQQGDVSFDNGGDFSKWTFEAGPGIYYQNDLWYAGLSVPNVMPNRLYDPYYEQLFARNSRHVFATAGVVLRMSDAIQFRPSLMAKYVGGAPLALDLSTAFYFKEKIGLGVSYRPDNAVVGMFEIFITSMLRLGYAYDHPLNKVQSYGNGSHELMLGLDFGFSKTRMVSPKLF